MGGFTWTMVRTRHGSYTQRSVDIAHHIFVGHFNTKFPVLFPVNTERTFTFVQTSSPLSGLRTNLLLVLLQRQSEFGEHKIVQLVQLLVPRMHKDRQLILVLFQIGVRHG